MKKMIFLFLFLIIAVLSAPCFCEANIPLGSSRWTDRKDYKNALCIDNFNKSGNVFQGDPKTSLYLKYDSENVYAMFECTENEKGYPLSFERSSVSDLMQDDAVMLVFGISGENSVLEKMNMGGYEGAYSEMAQADYYYQFVTNSRGVNARTFNETPMERPLFESKVKKEKKNWLVFMKIPFSSWGIKNPIGKEVFFNAYRFRPPYLLGYYNIPYGGYAPFPFEKIKFSTKTEGEILLNENKTKNEEKSENFSEFSFRFYPAKRIIAGQIKAENLAEKTYIEIETEDKRIEKELKEGYTNLCYELDENISLPLDAVCRVKRGEKVLQEEKLTVKSIPPKPDYMNTQAGKGISVPSPWKKPVLDDNRIILANKIITMGESGFFSSVIGKRELLASPVRLGISVKGKTLNMKKIAQTGTVKDTYVLFDTKLSDGKNTCDVRIKTDFDGFSTIKFRLEDINPEDIDKIYLDIPLAPHKDMYVHRVVSQTIQKLEGFGWNGKGDSSLWLGTHDMGIAYEADMPVFLSENMRKQIEIKENKEETLLRFNFVDGKGQVKDKGHIFRFYLTPTPTKNYSLDKTGLYHGMDLWFENWSDWQGYPDMNKVPEMRERNRKDEEEGRKLIIYFSQSLASDSPASLDFFTDLTAYPERGWYKRAYDPGKDVVCYVSCLRELYGDLLLDRIKKLMKETGVNSVYLDGPANPWECTNPTHNHCETNAEITWEDGDMCPYEATRDFMKRLRGVLSQSGKPFKIIAHTGGAIYPSTMSFCDGHYEGEQMARFRQGYRLPLSVFAIGYCGMPWGFRVDELPMKPIYSVEQIRTLALLHDSCVGDGPYGESGRETEEKIYGDFQGADTEYYPYWEEQSAVKYKGKSLMSFYKNSDSAMIILGNLNYDTDKGVLDVSGLFGKNVYVYDVLNNKYINDSPDAVNIETKPWRYTALRIDKEKKETVKEEIKNFINSEKYDIINSAEDLLCNKPCERDGISVKVRGIKYDTAAEISFAKSLGNEFYGEFQIERENIVSICFGETVFTLYNETWTAENLSFWNEGLFISGNFSEKQLNIKISVKDEKITVLCNDRPVCVQVTANTGDRKISFRTWNDDTIKVIPLRLISEYKELAEIIHPVR